MDNSYFLSLTLPPINMEVKNGMSPIAVAFQISQVPRGSQISSTIYPPNYGCLKKKQLLHMMEVHPVCPTHPSKIMTWQLMGSPKTVCLYRGEKYQVTHTSGLVNICSDGFFWIPKKMQEETKEKKEGNLAMYFHWRNGYIYCLQQFFL